MSKIILTIQIAIMVASFLSTPLFSQKVRHPVSNEKFEFLKSHINPNGNIFYIGKKKKLQAYDLYDKNGKKTCFLGFEYERSTEYKYTKFRGDYYSVKNQGKTWSIFNTDNLSLTTFYNYLESASTDGYMIVTGQNTEVFNAPVPTFGVIDVKNNKIVLWPQSDYYFYFAEGNFQFGKRHAFTWKLFNDAGIFQLGQETSSKTPSYYDKEGNYVSDGKLKMQTGNNLSKNGIWRDFRSPATYSWSGSSKDNYLSGKGILKVFSNGKLWKEYNGEMVDGRMHGYGELVDFHYKYTYKGNWQNGKENGEGELQDDLGEVHVIGKFKGTFKNGVEWNGSGYNHVRGHDYSFYDGEYSKSVQKTSSSSSDNSSSSGSCYEYLNEYEKWNDAVFSFGGNDYKPISSNLVYKFKCTSNGESGVFVNLIYNTETKSFWDNTNYEKGWYFYDSGMISTIRHGPYKTLNEAVKETCRCN